MAQNLEYIAIVLALAFIAIAIVFLFSQQKVLQLVEPQFRQMRPGQVWLQLIPVFGLVWQYIVVSRVSSSIQSQLLASAEDTIVGSTVDPSHRPTYRPGIAYCVLLSVGACVGLIPSMALAQSAINLIGLIIWIVYWIELERYKGMLKLRTTSGATNN